MSTIEIRKMKKESWRVRLRPINYPVFSLTFSCKEDAENWVNEHEQKYIENPETYQKWIKENRKSLREKGIYHQYIPLENFLLTSGG